MADSKSPKITAVARTPGKDGRLDKWKNKGPIFKNS